MKLSLVKVSLVALVLVSAVGVADAKKKSSVDGLTPAGEIQDPTQEVFKIRRFLADGKDLSKMKLPRLQQRLVVHPRTPSLS